MTLQQVHQLLYSEADFADEHRYDEWLALWHPAGELLYWIPSGSDDLDPKQRISIVYDNRSRLDDRIFRLKSRGAHSQRPRSRMRRVVSNIVVETDDGDSVRVRANFILAELRKGHQDVFNGRFLYELRRHCGELRIATKKVLLVNNDEFIDNLSFLL